MLAKRDPGQMLQLSHRFDAVIAEIDAANAADPRMVAAGGTSRPYELAYAERMSAELQHIYPDASELLRARSISVAGTFPALRFRRGVTATTTGATLAATTTPSS
jgi:hypothetical protein